VPVTVATWRCAGRPTDAARLRPASGPLGPLADVAPGRAGRGADRPCEGGSIPAGL